MEYTVLIGLVIACLLAGSPIFISPFAVNATTEGVVLLPSLLMITVGSLPSITETQLLVVPKSIPIILPIIFISYFLYFFLLKIPFTLFAVCSHIAIIALYVSLPAHSMFTPVY